MAGELTIDHLNALADRIESSVRRDVDTLRAEVKDDVRQVHARVTELRDRVAIQNGRVLKTEEATAEVKRQVTAVRHDFNTHEGAHESFIALLRQTRGAPSGDDTKPSKAFVGGAIAAVIVLAGVAQIALDLLRPVAEVLLRVVKP